MAEERTPLERAHRLASRQHAAISRRQALDAGLSRHEIDSLLDSRRWSRAARGVYTVAGAPRTWHQRVSVTLLAAPTGAVASQLTAAALFGLVKRPDVPEFTVPPTANNRRGYRSLLGDGDICVVDGIRCTTPARTLIDCARIVDYDALCDLVDSALCRGLTSVAHLRRATGRSGRKGIPVLERALEVWTWGPTP